jgi:hypothetical protein
MAGCCCGRFSLVLCESIDLLACDGQHPDQAIAHHQRRLILIRALVVTWLFAGLRER